MTISRETPPMVLVPQKLIQQLRAVEQDLTAAETPHLAEDRQILHMVLTMVDECPHMSRADLLVKLEQGELSNEAVIDLFQSMIVDGTIWQAASCWQHLALQLVKAGYCTAGRDRRS